MLRRWLPPALGLPGCMLSEYLVASTTDSRFWAMNWPSMRSELPLV
jgi:hypothetical protein